MHLVDALIENLYNQILKLNRAFYNNFQLFFLALQSFLDINEHNLAFEFFKEVIKPILAEDKDWIVMVCSLDEASLIETYLELVKTIQKFQHFESYEANMKSFNKVINKNVKPEVYKELFENLMTGLNEYSTNENSQLGYLKQIMSLLKHRFVSFVDKLKRIL